MAIVRKHGKPDLFITMTCNPNWPEIQNNLLPGQSAADRPDLCARVFHQKQMELMDDLIKRNVFGRSTSHLYTIEFQKRGLPHAHILLILAPEDKLHNADDYDTVITAEIPDRNQDPDLYDVSVSASLTLCLPHLLL